MADELDVTQGTATMTPELREAVAALIRKNRFLEAMKLVRERAGWSLRDSKEAVDAIREGRAVPQPRPPAVPELDATTRKAAEALLAQGLVSDAIMIVRDRTGWTVEASKKAVDEIRGAPQAPAPDAVDELAEMATRLAPVRERVVGLVVAGRKIDAIKLVREATGMSLAEAKAYVEGLP